MNSLKKFFTKERVILTLVCFALYANILRNEYCIDDSYVTQKDNVTSQGLRSIPTLLTSFYANEKGQKYDYRPLVKISYAVEHQFFGTSAGVSHFFNIVLYIICVFLLYRLMELLVLPARNSLPFFAALLFAFLPIHTEVVASLKNRDVLLCFIFTLNAVIVLLRAHSENKVKPLTYLFVAINFCLALLSKYDVLPYLAILPFIIYTKYNVKMGRILLYAFAILFMLALTRFLSRQAVDIHAQTRTFHYFENPLYFNSEINVRFIALFNCLGFYVVQCAFPFKQSFYYGEESVSVTEFSMYGFLGIAVACLLLWGLYHAWKKNKKNLLIGLVMFGASVSMYLNFVTPAVGIVADRFAFFSSAGFCVLIIFLVQDWRSIDKKLPGNVKVGGIIILLLYSFLTISRNADWKNSVTLIEKDIQKYPNSAYLNYLDAINVMSNIEKNKNSMTRPQFEANIARARQRLETSLVVSGDYANSLNFLAYIVTFVQKDYAAGLDYVNRSLKIKKTVDLVFYKGVCLRGLKNDSSEYYLKETLRMDSASYNAYRLLSEGYNEKGNYQASLDLLNGALKKGLQSETIFTGLAATYLAMHDTTSTIFYCEKAFAINPSSKQAQEIKNKLK